MAKIVSHAELDVYRRAFDAAMHIFRLSQAFPKCETYSLTDQIRRSLRSVTANIAEAWRKRRYPHAFVAKLSDAEAEAAETQVWIEYAARCEYANRDTAAALYREYDELLRMLVAMINAPDKWVIG